MIDVNEQAVVGLAVKVRVRLKTMPTATRIKSLFFSIFLSCFIFVFLFPAALLSIDD